MDWHIVQLSVPELERRSFEATDCGRVVSSILALDRVRQSYAAMDERGAFCVAGAKYFSHARKFVGV